MNVIILDIDGLDRLGHAEAVKERLLLDEGTQVVPLSDLEAAGFALPSPWQGSLTKCILLTAYSGGFMQYHETLVRKNPARLWCFCALDVPQQILREQLISQTMSRPQLRQHGQFRLIFDDSASLAAARDILALPIGGRFTCVVASCDLRQAEALAQTLSERCEADFLPAGPDCEALLRSADALILTGCDEGDFTIPFVQGGQYHLAVWLGDAMSTLNASERQRRLERLADHLAGQGWDRLRCLRQMQWGDLYTEALSRRWRQRDITLATLLGDDRFVLVDDYGLPCTGQAYTDEQIEDFFRRSCHLDQLIEALHIR